MSRPSFALPLAAAAGLLLLSAAGAARAQTSRLYTSNWRQEDRADSIGPGSSAQWLAIEVRFGQYSPNIDSEPSFAKLPAEKRPYAQVFGDGAQFYFGLEIDLLPLRIPYLGLIGPGFGWGFTTTSAKARFIGGKNDGQESGQTTSLTIMPMYLAAVLRADELMRRTGIPIVPYGKFGFGLATWRASSEAGTETYDDGKGGDPVSAFGVSWGIHFAVGGMLSLNFIDPRSAARLDETTGVNHAYLFGEWMNNADIGRHSDPQGMYVGSSTWVVGFAVDM